MFQPNLVLRCAFIPLSVCPISRQSDMEFTFYGRFCKVTKRRRKRRKEEKTKKLSQFLKSHILGTLEAISLKFGMWSTEVGGYVHSKSSCFNKAAQSYGGVKIAFSFFLSIYSWVLRPDFLGCTTHYRVS